MTDEQLREIRERCEKATPGEWGWRYSKGQVTEVVCSDSKTPIISWMGFDDAFRPIKIHKANADFIAHARQDVPAMLAEIDRLKIRIAELETKHRHIHPNPDMDQPTTVYIGKTPPGIVHFKDGKP